MMALTRSRRTARGQLGCVRRVHPDQPVERIDTVVVAHHLPQTTTLRTSSLDCRVVSTHRRAESTHSLDRQCRHRRFGALDLAEDIRRVRSDHARCPIGENDDEPKFTISSLKRLGNQPLTAKRMRRRDNCYLCRQPLAKLLQSVAVTVGAGKSVAVRAAVAGLDRTRYTVVYLANPSGGVPRIVRRDHDGARGVTEVPQGRGDRPPDGRSPAREQSAERGKKVFLRSTRPIFSPPSSSRGYAC